MATKQSTIDYLQDQLATVPGVSARKMFGEYALYCQGRVVALVCDDELFVKITDPGQAFVGQYYQEGRAYPGAKPSMHISGDRIEDREWLGKLIQITADNVPLPKAKPERP
jgi:DNA transformation protein and related proteins